MTLRRAGQPVPEKDNLVLRSIVILVGSPLLLSLYFTVVYLLGEFTCKVVFWRSVVPLNVLLGVVTLLLIGWVARSARNIGSSQDEVHRFIGAVALLLSALAALVTVAVAVISLVLPLC